MSFNALASRSMFEDEQRCVSGSTSTDSSGDITSSSTLSESSVATTVENYGQSKPILATDAGSKGDAQISTSGEGIVPDKAKASDTDVLNSKKTGDAIDANITTTPSKILYRTELLDHVGKVTKEEQGSEPIKGSLAAPKDGGPVLEIAPTRGLSKAAGNNTRLEDLEDPDREYEPYTSDQTEMRIHSEELIDALRTVVEYYPGESLLGQPVTLSEPYHLLVHHQKELCEYKSACAADNDEEYRHRRNVHIDVLLEFLDRQLGKGIKDEEERCKRTPPVCTYEFLCLLLKPGEIFFDLNGTPFPFVIKGCKGGMSNGEATPYEILAFRVNGNGEYLGCENLVTRIMPFDGEQDFRSLKLCPARFYEDIIEVDGKQGALSRQALIARGKKWCELKKCFAYKEYDGKTTTASSRVVKGRVIIDFKNAFKEPRGKLVGDSDLDAPMLQKGSHGSDLRTSPGRHGCHCNACANLLRKTRRKIYDGWDNIDPHGLLPDDENFYMLCSRNVPAFVLKERRWEWLDVGGLTETRNDQSAFKNLVLDRSIKDTIVALSQSYSRSQDMSRNFPIDFIRGKGEGQIFLLHGPPGVGKTCTAECVAELTDRPLLSLTCGDIGVTGQQVEDALGNYLRLGETWGAVVLLDEADVYLEARTVADIKRNSLVSVFLRALEYYRGLLVKSQRTSSLLAD